MELFKSLETRTKLFSDPFKHFEINEPLTKSAIDEIFNADIADPRKQNLNYDGTRALDGGGGAFREGIKDGGHTEIGKLIFEIEKYDEVDIFLI